MCGIFSVFVLWGFIFCILAPNGRLLIICVFLLIIKQNLWRSFPLITKKWCLLFPGEIHVFYPLLTIWVWWLLIKAAFSVFYFFLVSTNIYSFHNFSNYVCIQWFFFFKWWPFYLHSWFLCCPFNHSQRICCTTAWTKTPKSWSVTLVCQKSKALAVWCQQPVEHLDMLVKESDTVCN